MMTDWWAVLIAFVVGANVGAFLMALLRTAADDDDAATVPQMTEAEVDQRLADLARRIEDDRWA